MRKAAIERVEAALMASDREPFNIGDAVEVGLKIQEGDKDRVQVFAGTVIGRRGKGAAETFAVRRIVAGEGVERTFPLRSPHIAFVRVLRSGKVRRAKLYYLRKRVGKATRLSERHRVAVVGEESAPGGAAPASPPGEAKPEQA
jgi:large subunit ribosomal protein L19